MRYDLVLVALAAGIHLLWASVCFDEVGFSPLSHGHGAGMWTKGEFLTALSFHELEACNPREGRER